MITKNCPDIPKFRKYSSIVLTVIHTFGPLIEQLSLAIEIIVKCSHACPSNKSVNIFGCSCIGKWELIHTLVHSLFRLKHKTAHHQSMLALNFSFTANMIKQ